MLTALLAFLWFCSLLSAGHALLTKRDPRAGLGWIVTCLALPGLGALLYWLLGVNRIRSRARELQKQGQGMHWLDVGLLGLWKVMLLDVLLQATIFVYLHFKGNWLDMEV